MITFKSRHLSFTKSTFFPMLRHILTIFLVFFILSCATSLEVFAQSQKKESIFSSFVNIFTRKKEKQEMINQMNNTFKRYDKQTQLYQQKVKNETDVVEAYQELKQETSNLSKEVKDYAESQCRTNNMISFDYSDMKTVSEIQNDRNMLIKKIERREKAIGEYKNYAKKAVGANFKGRKNFKLKNIRKMRDESLKLLEEDKLITTIDLEKPITTLRNKRLNYIRILQLYKIDKRMPLAFGIGSYRSGQFDLNHGEQEDVAKLLDEIIGYLREIDDHYKKYNKKCTIEFQFNGYVDSEPFASHRLVELRREGIRLANEGKVPENKKDDWYYVLSYLRAEFIQNLFLEKLSTAGLSNVRLSYVSVARGMDCPPTLPNCFNHGKSDEARRITVVKLLSPCITPAAGGGRK